jgi:carbon-monoxide dehydrogenase medium subunit
MSRPVTVVRPHDLVELAALLRGGAAFLPVAGGTDLLIEGRVLPRGPFLDLSRVAGMAGIAMDTGARVVIGAATRVAAIAGCAELAGLWPMLTQAAAACGAAQIRNRATIGGNVANAAPAADLVPPLMLAGASLRLIGGDGVPGDCPIDAFRPGSGAILTHVELSWPKAGTRSAFVKLGLRDELTIARLNLAGTARVDDGALVDLQLVAGALGPRPIRLARAAAALEGRIPDAAALAGFVDALSGEVASAIAGRASAPWKGRAIRGLGLDLIAGLLGGDRREPPFCEVF